MAPYGGCVRTATRVPEGAFSVTAEVRARRWATPVLFPVAPQGAVISRRPTGGVSGPTKID